jgi:hypothetical protein
MMSGATSGPVEPKRRGTDEQIEFALKQAELSISVEEVCRKMGVDVWRLDTPFVRGL